MSGPFLITGLPRSRTAWLSVAAGNDQSICWHEPTGWLDRWQDVYRKIWWGSAERYVGISDSALGFHLPEIIRTVSPRVLIVERDIIEVEASLARLGVPRSNYCTLLGEALAYEHPSILRVPFHDLADSRNVVMALRHLMPEAWISLDRIESLQCMNIQTDMGRVGRLGEQRKGDMVALLGSEIANRLKVEV